MAIHFIVFMKTLSFHIPYHTSWGEHVQLYCSVDGNTPELLPLDTIDGENWHLQFSVSDEAENIRHTYCVTDEQGELVRIEDNAWRYFEFRHRSQVCFSDVWAELSIPYFYTHTAFSKCVLRPRGGEALHLEMLSASCLLLLHALPPSEGKRWGIIGSTPNLGEWDVERIQPLKRTDTYEWGFTLSRQEFEQGAEYKYVLYDPASPKDIIWEEGGNRFIQKMNIKAHSAFVRQDEMPRISSATPWRGAGVVIPVFSLRSKGSFGIGDFGDLLTMIRWASEVGMKAVQLLPINDTTRTGTWGDSYPYSGISVFALHPIYINAREWKESHAYNVYKEEAYAINELEDIDYEAAFRLKTSFLHDLYTEIGKNITALPSFKEYQRVNNEWLQPYTEFCALRDIYHTADFRSWPQTQENDSEAFVEKTKSLELYYAFVQFLLHRQMKRCHDEARERGIILKGDIPIGISRDSVPARTDSRLFHFDGQAGAPPDAFACFGQNWGFPTYDWEEMAKDNYAWWRKRLSHMGQYFDAYRIDHVLGFFRIWEIPYGQYYGLLGRFRPAMPMSEKEIKSFGFQASAELLSKPIVNTEQLEQLGDGIDLYPYFVPINEREYTLRPEYLTQQEVYQRIWDDKLRQIICDILSDVLFIPDPEKPQTFHPRILGMETPRFQSLSISDQEAYRRLHDEFFFFRHNDFWANEAMKRLPTITQSIDTQEKALRLRPLHYTSLLPCAEDLGMLPMSVKGVLERLQILSLEIQRMPKEYGVRFGNLQNNPYLSVATIDTHDMPPLRLWWKESREQTEAFWHDALQHHDEVPIEATPAVCEEVVKRHLDSPSALCLISLQDWFAINPRLSNFPPEKEQINVPANADNYWRYRMHIPLESLIADTDYNEHLRSLLVLHKR